MSDVKRVGVLGCGLMGSGIAQVAATAGYETIVRDISNESPLGRALLHHKVGDSVDVHAPAGVRTVHILSIE